MAYFMTYRMSSVAFRFGYLLETNYNLNSDQSTCNNNVVSLHVCRSTLSCCCRLNILEGIFDINVCTLLERINTHNRQVANVCKHKRVSNSFKPHASTILPFPQPIHFGLYKQCTGLHEFCAEVFVSKFL